MIEEKIKELKSLLLTISKLEEQANKIREEVFEEVKTSGGFKNEDAVVSLVKKKIVKYDEAIWKQFCIDNGWGGYLESKIVFSKKFEDDLKNGVEFPGFVDIPEYEIIEKENLAIRFTK